MPKQPKDSTNSGASSGWDKITSGWDKIIGLIKSRLQFFALVVLVLVTVCTAVAVKTSGVAQIVTICLTFLILVVVIVIVTFRKDILEGNTMASKDFCKQVSGNWWEIIKPDTTAAISFLKIYYDEITNTVNMKGQAFDKSGNHLAEWNSLASCIQPNQKKIFYYWEGYHDLNAALGYWGFGKVFFDPPDESSERCESGNGTYSDTNAQDLKTTTMKSVDYSRCNDEEAKTMTDKSADDREKRKLVIKKLGSAASR